MKKFIQRVRQWLKNYRERTKKIRDAGGVTSFLREK
jgi:hypothetical protein